MSPLADWQFGVDAQSEVILTTHIATGISFITAHMAYVSTNKTKLFKLRQSTFLTEADVPHVYVLLSVLFSQSYHCPNLLEDADIVGGRMRRDKECPFSGITSYGRVCRKGVGKQVLDQVDICHFKLQNSASLFWVCVQWVTV